MFYEFKGFKPVVHESAFVHPQAVITGNVVIGKDVYIGPCAAIRGDWGGIIIEDGCNVQENCTIHMFPGVTVRLKKAAHIGHGAVIHGATIGENVMVGMNAVVMDRVEVGANSIIGALAFVNWKSKGTSLYQALPKELYESLKPCEPLRTIPEHQPNQETLFETWNQVKDKS
jgi:phenylacetic acid degradation protein